MATTFPTSKQTFTQHTDNSSGDLMDAADVNDVQDTVAALEDAVGLTGSAGNMPVGASRVLGYAEVTANQNFTDNSETDVTSLSVTVTVPNLKSAHKVRITGYIPYISTAGTTTEAELRIYESTTLLNRTAAYIVTGTETNQGMLAQWIGSPTAGSHTYKLKFKNNVSTTTTLNSSATDPAFILVELL